jgi:DNA repair protein SbcD/Mre11
MLRALRLVHVADCHLDAPSRSMTRTVRERVEESARVALQRAVTLAIDEQADALLLAGDLFDRDLVRLGTEMWLPEVLGEAVNAGVTVISVTGNHDPGVTATAAERIAWPAKRFFVVRRRAPQVISVTRRDGSVAGVVVAAGHEVAREQENLVAGFPRDPAPGVPTAGLVHAQVHGYEGIHDRYAPCLTRDLDRAGYGYWALGHVHQRVQVSGMPLAWYAGCLHGRDFGESGAKGALVVEVTPSGAEAEFFPLAPVRWELVTLDDLDRDVDTPMLIRRIEQRFEQLQRDRHALADQDWVLRIGLSGRTPLFTELRGAEAADDLALVVRDRLQVLDVEVRDAGLLPPVDVDKHRGAPHVLGVTVDLVEEARRDYQLLERLAPEALAAAPTDAQARRQYLRSLLAGIDAELAARLLDDEQR